MFHLIGALKDHGKVGTLCVGRTREVLRRAVGMRRGAFTFGDQQVMHGVVLALCHQPDKPQPANARNRSTVAWIAGRNHKAHAARNRSAAGPPSAKRLEHRCVRADHTPHRRRDRRIAGDIHRKARWDLLRAHASAERDGVHVDQMLPQRLKIYLRPIRARVGLEHLHDLADGRKGGLTTLRRHRRGRLVLHARRMLHAWRVCHAARWLLGTNGDSDNGE